MSRLLQVACRLVLALVMPVAPLAAGPAAHLALSTGADPAGITSSVDEPLVITRLERQRDYEKRNRELKQLAKDKSKVEEQQQGLGQQKLDEQLQTLEEKIGELDENAGSTEFGLGDALLVTVKPWKPNDLEADKSAWVLKINGIALPGVTAEAINFNSEVTPNEAVFQFFLQTGESNREEWNALLRYPLRGGGLTKRVSVGIQAPAGFGAIITPKEVDFIVISTKRLYPLAAFFVIVTVVLVALARRSSILRGPRGLLYSLGRTQMAWWFVIILGSYLFLGISTFNWSSTIPASALVLLGIAASTALGSVMIDGDKDKRVEEANVQREVLPERMRAVEQLLTQSATPADVAGLSSTLVELQGQLNKATAAAKVPGRSTKNFLMDLISDSRGVSLHRFQNVVWTFVLGGVYVFSVGTELSMPEFNSTLLSLMGISSGTYVAFKFPEK